MFATYNELLYSFDRLTCGAVTKLLQGEDIALDAGQGGDSYAAIDPITDPYYYIETRMDDLMFVIGVSIPDGFEPEITHYEIWYEGTRLGERVPTTKQIRHLTLDYGETQQLTIRFFKDDAYVQECDIDTTVARGTLDLEEKITEEENQPRIFGSFEKTQNAYTGLVYLNFTFSEEYGVAAYQIVDQNGKTLYQDEPIAAERQFFYLGMLDQQLEMVTIVLYDAEGGLIASGSLDAGTLAIVEKVG
jgi:hypothetical protein